MQLNLFKSVINKNFKSIVPSVGLKKCSKYHKFDHKFNSWQTFNGSDFRLRRLLISVKKLFNYKSINNSNNLINHRINCYDINRRLVLISTQSSSYVPKREFSSKSGNQSDSDSELYEDDEDLFHEPPKVRYGLLKVALIIVLGTYAGSLFAMFGANFLEEFEIFVKDDDDDDD